MIIWGLFYFVFIFFYVNKGNVAVFRAVSNVSALMLQFVLYNNNKQQELGAKLCRSVRLSPLQ